MSWAKNKPLVKYAFLRNVPPKHFEFPNEFMAEVQSTFVNNSVRINWKID